MRDTRKCVAGLEAGICLDRNFSRAEKPRLWGMLVYREVKSMLTNKILGGREWEGEEMIRIFNV